VGLVSTSLEMALVLVFIGFDYCPGLFLLVRNPDTIHIPQPSSNLLPPPLFGFCRPIFRFHNHFLWQLSPSQHYPAVEQALAYYASSLIIVYSTPRWIRAMFFATQLVLTDVSLSPQPMFRDAIILAGTRVFAFDYPCVFSLLRASLRFWQKALHSC